MKYAAALLLVLLSGSAFADEDYRASWWWYGTNSPRCTQLPAAAPPIKTPWEFAEATKQAAGIEYREEIINAMLLVYREARGNAFYVAALTEAN